MSHLRKFVHVRLDGNQVFFKGESIEIEEDVVTVHKGSRFDEGTVAIIRLQPGESVGEFFTEEQNKIVKEK